MPQTNRMGVEPRPVPRTGLGVSGMLLLGLDATRIALSAVGQNAMVLLLAPFTRAVCTIGRWLMLSTVHSPKAFTQVRYIHVSPSSFFVLHPSSTAPKTLKSADTPCHRLTALLPARYSSLLHLLLLFSLHSCKQSWTWIPNTVTVSQIHHV